MSRVVISLALNCFLWISFSIHGQEKYSPFKFTYPSANAASLGTFGTYQVGYDGRPGIGIELINVKNSSHNCAMSLSYDASGLKPGQTEYFHILHTQVKNYHSYPHSIYS